MRRGKPPSPEIKRLKRKLVAIILSEIESMSTVGGNA
jgi:hypothetical protein